MRRNGGFTLVEVMIVVAIIGILAGILVYSLDSPTKRVKSKGEVLAMFEEIARTQREYSTEHGVYYSTGTDSTDIFPASPVSQPTPLGTLPDEWITLKISPPSDALLCGYVVVAGTEADSLPDFADDFGMVQPPGNWFAMYAECNQDNNTAVNGTFFASSVDAKMQRRNETR